MKNKQSRPYLRKFSSSSTISTGIFDLGLFADRFVAFLFWLTVWFPMQFCGSGGVGGGGGSGVGDGGNSAEISSNC